jgi:hypothetical protein
MDDYENISSLLDLLNNSPAPQNARKNGSAARPTKGKTGVLPAASEHQLSPPPVEIPQGTQPFAPAVPRAVSPQLAEPPATAVSSPPAASPQVAETLTPVIPEQPDRDPDERTLTEAAGPIYLFASSQQTLKTSCQPEGFLSYRERFLGGCGNPGDPVEVLLIENLMLAYHNIGRLLVLSADTRESEAICAYTAAAARLMAELRRGALTLQDYRAKARDAQRERSKADRRKKGKTKGLRPKDRAPRKKHCNGKLGSNGHGKIPLCLQKRFDFPTPGESLPAEAIGCGARS